jgi:hypothetical protein
VVAETHRKLSPMQAKRNSSLKMEAACSSKTLVSAHKTTRCHNPEEHNLNNHRQENLKTCEQHILCGHQFDMESYHIDDCVSCFKSTSMCNISNSFLSPAIMHNFTCSQSPPLMMFLRGQGMLCQGQEVK